ncbi:MAG: polymer-forming cytoskeletal protein [Georgfuchsia sp.]
MFKTSGPFGKNNDSVRDARYQNINKPTVSTSSQSSTSAASTSMDKPTETAAQETLDNSNDNDTTIGNRLIVGPDVKLKGAEINDCDTLVVEGRVEATLESRIIRIAEQGSFNGTVGVDMAEVHGHFDGELTARGQLLIHATGHVNGKIRYGKILIEEGGQISGDVQTITSNAASIQTNIKSERIVSAI